VLFIFKGAFHSKKNSRQVLWIFWHFQWTGHHCEVYRKFWIFLYGCNQWKAPKDTYLNEWPGLIQYSTKIKSWKPFIEKLIIKLKSFTLYLPSFCWLEFFLSLKYVVWLTGCPEKLNYACFSYFMICYSHW